MDDYRESPASSASEEASLDELDDYDPLTTDQSDEHDEPDEPEKTGVGARAGKSGAPPPEEEDPGKGERPCLYSFEAPPAPDGQRARAVGTRTVYIIPPEQRVTSNRLTLGEVTRAIGIRAQQIERYASPYTEIGGLTDPIEIARKELYERRTPLVLCREVGRTPDGDLLVENWKVREMAFPALN
jgi:DNA-directed RNA polymerase I, II, and III subunit RPABC2